MTVLYAKAACHSIEYQRWLNVRLWPKADNQVFLQRKNANDPERTFNVSLIIGIGQGEHEMSLELISVTRPTSLVRLRMTMYLGSTY